MADDGDLVLQRVRLQRGVQRLGHHRVRQFGVPRALLQAHGVADNTAPGLELDAADDDWVPPTTKLEAPLTPLDAPTP